MPWDRSRVGKLKNQMSPEQKAESEAMWKDVSALHKEMMTKKQLRANRVGSALKTADKVNNRFSKKK